MGALGGGALRLAQTALYFLEFCCAGIILGIYSYFLAVLSHHHTHITTWEKAVEGISGAAALYMIFAVLLTCFLGGVSFFAFIAIVLDILFIGGFLAIAILTRQGANKCTGTVRTPLGTGLASSHDSVNNINLGLACRLNTAVFAVAIIGAFLFLCTAALQVALVRHHKKEKRFGPSPANNYTSGSGNRKFWQRKQKNHNNVARDAELGAVGAGGLAVADHHHNKDLRPSHDTAYTGSTVAAGGNNYNDANAHNSHFKRDAEIGGGVVGAGALAEHEHHGHHHNGVTPTNQEHGYAGAQHGGYYSQPTGTAVNPFGYDNTANANARTTGTNF